MAKLIIEMVLKTLIQGNIKLGIWIPICLSSIIIIVLIEILPGKMTALQQYEGVFIGILIISLVFIICTLYYRPHDEDSRHYDRKHYRHYDDDDDDDD